MTTAYGLSLDSRVQRAVDELTGLIRASYPQAQFEVLPHPEEASTTLLTATVDVEDLDEVLDLVFERMEHLRIEEEVPILVVPLHTPERVAAMLAARARPPVPLPRALI